ncbi:MAG TPA: dienelactone hydrolase family protein [Gemmatimonadaceae bacterium]|jgi:carboxymethylenebutenolidase
MSFFRTIAFGGSALLLATACSHSKPMDEHMAHMSAGDLAEQPSAVAGQGAANLPASNNNAQARLAASPRHSEWVKVAWEPGSKDSLMAFIVYPTTSNAKTPVVVVIHEIFGLSTWVRGLADQTAAEGFIAIAPDLNSKVRGGPSTTELSRDSAQKLANQVPMADRNKAIDAVAKYAMSQPSAAQKYAVIGFCYGGSTVWGHTINGGISGFSGGVAFYGTPPAKGAAPDPDSIAKISKPIMLLSGSKDARIGAMMPAIDSAMKASKKWYYGNNYPGAVHGFMRAQDDPKAPARDEAEEKANLDAAKDAWPRTVTFLKTNLGVK